MCICKNLPDFRYSQYRPSCIPNVSSTPNLHGMEARSAKSSNQCHVLTMGKNVPICLSSFQPNTPGIVKTKERRDHNYVGGANMAIKRMVFSSSEHAYSQSEGPTSGHMRKNSSFKTSGLVGFRKPLASKGISDKAAKLIPGSRRESSISSYKSTWD